MSISSKKPLYYQLKQTLLKWIEGGDYPPGSILPSEKQLQDSFGISRTTVRMALKELEQEGFLVRSPGKGTFVASMKIESGPRRILSFTQEMLNMGLQVSNQVVSLEKELPVIRTANKLQIPQDQPVWRLERIRMADSVPIATEVNYIPAALVPNMEAQLAQNQSFYSCLEEECQGRHHRCDHPLHRRGRRRGLRLLRTDGDDRKLRPHPAHQIQPHRRRAS